MSCGSGQLEPMISLRQLGKRLRLSPRTIRELRDKEGMPVYHLGKRWQRVIVREVREWLDSRKNASTGPN